MPGLIKEDFELTDTQIKIINDYMREQNDLFNIDANSLKIKVTFNFVNNNRVIGVRLDDTQDEIVLL